MEQLNDIVGLISGSVSSIVLPFLGYLFVYESKKRKEYADGWQKLYEQRDRRVGELNEKIDQLYTEKEKDRQRIRDLQEKNTALSLDNMVLKMKECQVKGCKERVPPSDY